MENKKGGFRIGANGKLLGQSGKSKGVEMTEDNIIAGLYKPRTKFLKNKISNANFSKKSDRKYIVELCKVEDDAYRYHVKHESKNFYGSYVFLNPEEYGQYRKEFFEILKELSYKDYLRVIANELFNPKQYGPDKRWKPFKLEEFGVKEQKEIKHIIERLAKGEKSKKQHDQEKEKEELDNFHEWWVKNSNNSKEV